MQGRICVLAKETADRIAAGEVVDRPSSIVKELLENALDAGATEVTIELEKGGTRAIKMVDNGSGIDCADIALAFERHATSKISRFEDLYDIASFGFRGEALPSIAAVAVVEMVTRKKGALSGCSVRIENGRVVESRETGCPEGTSVLVRDIFGAVPVRKKFLKKEATEQAHCLEVITRTALPRAGLKIRVIAGSRQILNIPGAENLAERLSLVLGVDAGEHLIAVDRKRGGVKVSGFVSKPDFTRSSAKGLFCYVNGRYVRDPLVSHAVMTAYRRLIEARRYPQAVLFLELAPGDVDVNVHPAKMEVRFRNPREVYEAVLTALVGALAAASRKPGEPYAFAAAGSGDNLLREYGGRIEEAMRRYNPYGETVLPAAVSRVMASRDGGDSLFDEEGDREGFFGSLEYLGQAGMTYLVFSGPEGLVVVDQHAAHERLLFEKLKGETKGGELLRQQLLVPEILHLSPGDLALLSGSIGLFGKMGIEIEPFGGDAVRVRSFPVMLSHVAPKTVILDMIGEIAELGRTAGTADLTERLLTSLACRGAVKANERLTKEEVRELCRDLDAAPSASTCPHGRPLYIRLGFRDLEKLFKRT